MRESGRDQMGRVELHKVWEDEQDALDMKAVLEGVRRGFRNGKSAEEGEVRQGVDVEGKQGRWGGNAGAAHPAHRGI